MKSTVNKILDAAEKQFAQYGVEGVSLRQIIAAAGVSQGSLHYHFSSKDGLVQAVLDRHLPSITEERVAILKEIIATSPQPTVRELISVIVIPLARRTIEGGPSGKTVVRMLGRMYNDNNPVYVSTSEKYFKQVNNKFVKLIGDILPFLSKAQIQLRLRFTVAVIFSALVSLDSPPPSLQTPLKKSRSTSWDIVEELLDFLAQGVCANTGK